MGWERVPVQEVGCSQETLRLVDTQARLWTEDGTPVLGVMAGAYFPILNLGSTLKEPGKCLGEEHGLLLSPWRT